MLWWLTGELLIAAVIVVIACWMRQYWLGGVLVFLRKSARMFSHSPNGISLGSVLTQVGKR